MVWGRQTTRPLLVSFSEVPPLASLVQELARGEVGLHWEVVQLVAHTIAQQEAYLLTEESWAYLGVD